MTPQELTAHQDFVRDFGTFAKEYGKGIVKSVLNVGIGAHNLGDEAWTGGQNQVAPYASSNEIQAVGMRRGDQGMALSVLAGKSGGPGVMMAETKGTTVVAGQVAQISPKVQSIVTEIKNANIQVTLNPRNAATAQEGNVTLASGNKQANLRVETHPMKQNGPPVRHVNVEVTKKVKNKNKVVSNTHITE